MVHHLALEFCKSTDPRYKAVRDRHYVPNRGAVGQQVHFLALRGTQTLGIISGGSCAERLAARDKFFGITNENRTEFMRAIIDNTVFRLEVTEKRIITQDGREVPEESVATQILALWRKVVSLVWFDLYRAIPVGFETFVIESERRTGALYRADNWTPIGKTSGYSKVSQGLNAPHARTKTVPKLIFARKEDQTWMKEFGLKFVSSWRGNTPVEKQRRRTVSERRAYLTGRVFYMLRLKSGLPTICFTPVAQWSKLLAENLV